MKARLYVLPLLLILSACVGTRSAYHEAKTLDATAAVVGEHYYALVKEAANLKESGALSGTALAKVQAVDSQAKPLVIQLTEVAGTYRAVRTAENEAALQAALNEAVLALNAMIEALRSARGT